MAWLGKDKKLEESSLHAESIAAMKAMSDLMARLIDLLENRTEMFNKILENISQSRSSQEDFSARILSRLDEILEKINE